MPQEIPPEQTPRARAYELWMHAPNPMVSFFKTLDVTNLLRLSRRKGLKFNMLLTYCIGRAAAEMREFYLLPVGDKLLQYERLAVNTIVRNSVNEVSSCDVEFAEDLTEYNRRYLTLTEEVAQSCRDKDLSADCMVIGTSAIVETELDGAVGMNSGIFNNPFIIWGRYRKQWWRCNLPISFQFHHTQMDGAHAGCFLNRLQHEVSALRA